MVFVLREPGFTDSQCYVIFLLFFAIGLWITEAIPAFAVSLFIIAFLVFAMGNEHFNSAPEKIDKYVNTFSSSVIWLMLGGFFLALAMKKTKLDERFFQFAVRISGTNPRSLLFGLMMTTMVSDMALLATRDALTGLENRRAWNQALVSYLSEKRQLAVCMIDLDGLKAVNDAHGHPAGDEYLRQFARSLLASTPPNGRAYRFGGDEYAMLLPDGETRDLEQVMAELHTRDGIAPFSYGIASTEDQFNSGDELTELADSRMYEMKNERKRQLAGNTTVAYDRQDINIDDSNSNAE